jgi:hypothetical protein
MAFLLGVFLVLFPPFVWQVVDAGRWIEKSYWHFPGVVLFIAGVHIALQHQQRRMVQERASLPEDEDMDDFPQRLGLS